MSDLQAAADRFAERVDEVRYLDTSPLTGAPPDHSGDVPSAGTEPASASRMRSSPNSNSSPKS